MTSAPRSASTRPQYGPGQHVADLDDPDCRTAAAAHDERLGELVDDAVERHVGREDRRDAHLAQRLLVLAGDRAADEHLHVAVQHRSAADRVQEQRAFSAALAHLAAVRRLEPRIANPNARLDVRHIGDAIERVLRAIKEDDNLPAAMPLVEQILAPCEALLTEYVRLSSREVASAKATIEQTESRDLNRIRQTLDDVYEALHRKAVIDLAVLSEMIELNRDSITLTLPRRIEP